MDHVGALHPKVDERSDTGLVVVIVLTAQLMLRRGVDTIASPSGFG